MWMQGYLSGWSEGSLIRPVVGQKETRNHTPYDGLLSSTAPSLSLSRPSSALSRPRGAARGTHPREQGLVGDSSTLSRPRSATSAVRGARYGQVPQEVGVVDSFLAEGGLRSGGDSEGEKKVGDAAVKGTRNGEKGSVEGRGGGATSTGGKNHPFTPPRNTARGTYIERAHQRSRSGSPKGRGVGVLPSSPPGAAKAATGPVAPFSAPKVAAAPGGIVGPAPGSEGNLGQSSRGGVIRVGSARQRGEFDLNR
jgi:hypothetical protein